MENLKTITRDTIPCWYELSWREKQGMILRIHDDFVNHHHKILAEAPIVKHYAENFRFSVFAGEFGTDFGFEKSLKFLGQRDGFQEYLTPIPVIRKKSSQKCDLCDGSGQSLIFEGDKCLYCEGDGFEIVDDTAEACAILATLSLLFKLLRFPEIESSSKLPQLICVKTVVNRETNGFEVGGEYSREAVAWMKHRRAGEIPEMVSVMRVAWKKMEGEIKDYYDHSFFADISGDNGWLCASVPGDRTGIHPEQGSEHDVIFNGHGYKFSSHNVDRPIQQFAILASLAALHDLMRKDLE